MLVFTLFLKQKQNREKSKSLHLGRCCPVCLICFEVCFAYNKRERRANRRREGAARRNGRRVPVVPFEFVEILYEERFAVSLLDLHESAPVSLGGRWLPSGTLDSERVWRNGSQESQITSTPADGVYFPQLGCIVGSWASFEQTASSSFPANAKGMQNAVL